MAEITDEQITMLKDKGMTCANIKADISRQMKDAKKARKDAEIYRNFGINSQAERQEKIANAEEELAQFSRKLKKRLCPLR